MAKDKGKVLVVDDDVKLLELLRKFLEKSGYDVQTASSSGETLDLIELDKKYDCLIVDVMMPNTNGIELTCIIKQQYSIPVLLLTAMGEVEDRVKGLESGADDYLVKPFEPKELVLRIDNLIRLYRRINDVVDDGNEVIFGDFRFKMKEKDLRRANDNSIVNLTSTELDLVSFLCENINNPVSRGQISSVLNGISERSIDVQINRLRQKIETNVKEPIFLQTVRGQGYILRSRH